MKKIINFTLTLAVLLLMSSGCALFSSSALNPPSWINGTWTDASDMITWEFTGDNAIYTAMGISIDYKEISEQEGVEISDSSSDTEYEFTYEAGGVSVTYTFTPENDTTINYALDAATSIELYKE